MKYAEIESFIHRDHRIVRYAAHVNSYESKMHDLTDNSTSKYFNKLEVFIIRDVFAFHFLIFLIFLVRYSSAVTITEFVVSGLFECYLNVAKILHEATFRMFRIYIHG